MFLPHLISGQFELVSSVTYSPLGKKKKKVAVVPYTINCGGCFLGLVHKCLIHSILFIGKKLQENASKNELTDNSVRHSAASTVCVSRHTQTT